MTSTAREQLLETAVRLFYEHGCTATGIDRLLAESGVAKMTLYKNFGSKGNLILAATQRMRDQHHARMKDYIEARAKTPRDKIMALFDFIDDWVSSDDFHGCPFINVATEFGDLEHPAHRAAALYKREQRDYFMRLARMAGMAEPEELVDKLVLLIEGAVVLSHVGGDRKSIAIARAMAQQLLDDSPGVCRT
ncbi:MAG: TetR/AcrR family transcriptional regulator [Xanthomonadaceae bacterium]|nr:TetR/AcrR family transcriptional regulator [Xanthomonadaceae bacterium]